MNNQELELKIKQIIGMENMFDMICAAKKMESEYKKSDFFAITKMPLMEVIKYAKVFYSFNMNTIKTKIQKAIDELDLTSLNKLFDQVASTYEQENKETMEMVESLSDFKDIIKKN